MKPASAIRRVEQQLLGPGLWRFRGLGFRVRGLGLGFRVRGLGLGFRVRDLGFRVYKGLGFRVQRFRGYLFRVTARVYFGFWCLRGVMSG